MTEDEIEKELEIEFAFLQRRAFKLGLYAARHKDFVKRHSDQGPFYIRSKKKFFAGKEVGEAVCLARYVTAETAHACLDDYEKGTAKSRA